MYQEEPIQVVPRAAGPQCRDKDMTSSDIWILQHRPVCWFAATKREREGGGKKRNRSVHLPLRLWRVAAALILLLAVATLKRCAAEKAAGGKRREASGAAASTQFPSREAVLISNYA